MSVAAQFQVRRSALFERLKAPALFFSGVAPARNIPDVRYHYRCASHALYLAGPLPEASFLLIDDGSARLFLPEQPEYDEVWHGSRESIEKLRERTSCSAVLPLSRIVEELAAYPAVHLLEPFELNARHQCSLTLSACKTILRNDPRLLDTLIELRLVHDEEGVRQLEEAASKTASVFEATFASLPQMVTESDVAAYMEYRSTLLGAVPAFSPIVTQTPNVLHASVSERPLRSAPMLLIDYGVECASGYCCDVTRSLPQIGVGSGTLKEAVWEFYAMLLEVQERCIQALLPGTRFLELQLLAERLLLEGLRDLGILSGAQSELEDSGIIHYFFLHGLGHPIGLDVHDMQDLGDRVGYPSGRTRPAEFGRCFLRFDRDLAVGMAITLEPGCYFSPARLRELLRDKTLRPMVNLARLEQFAEIGGARIEDSVLLAENGPQVLSGAIPKSAASLKELTYATKG